MFDRKFLRSFASNPVEFIFAKKDRKTFFKKVKIATDTSFMAEGTDQLFEKQSTNVERFFSRSNLEPKLCLAEFVMFYDYAGVSESKELYKLFTQRGVEINDSEIRCAFSKEFLPEVILLRTGDVMKMRTNQKIIAFPSCEKDSSEEFYQKVLLYSPEAQEDMSVVDINVKYCAEDDPPVCDVTGRTLTVIERIER